MSGWRPLFRARLLEWRNAYRRIGGTAIALLAGGAIAVAAALPVAAARWREPARRISALIDAYAPMLAALAAVHAILLVARCKQRQRDMRRLSWLAAAPIAESTHRRWIVLNVLLAALRHLAIVIAILGAVSLLAGSAASISMSLIAAGFCAGAVVGWYLPPRDDSRREESRYSRRLRSQGSTRPSDRALSHWPIAQAVAWHRPEHSRYVVLAALCAVQGGSSMLVGLCVVITWLLAAYLIVLWQTTLRVGREAAAWLQSTPIGFAQFAWPLARRSLAHQAIGSLVLAGIGLMQGAPPAMTAHLLVLWLALIAGATTISLADSYCRRRSRLKLWLSAAGLAAIEWRQQGGGVAVALLAAVWHVRLATNFRRERA
jgi:hypothetical protein